MKGWILILILTLALAAKKRTGGLVGDAVIEGNNARVGDSQTDLIDDESRMADFELQDMKEEIMGSLDMANLELSHFVTDSEIKELIWCGTNNQVLLILSEDHTVYHSPDQGKNWEKKDSYLNLGNQNVAQSKIGKVFTIKASPIDSNLVFFLGDQGINWLSEDCGDTFKPLNNGRKIHDFVFHPIERNTAMASIYTTCEDFDDGDDCEIYKEVYYSQDLGTHWNFLTDHILQFDWGKLDGSDYHMHKDSVLVVRQKDRAQYRQNPWSAKNQIVSSDDFFKTEKVLLTGGNEFALTSDYMYAGRLDREGNRKLVVANRKDKFSQFFYTSQFKMGEKELDFTIIESESDAVFLFVKNDGDDDRGSIYISDAHGKAFSLSLKDTI